MKRSASLSALLAALALTSAEAAAAQSSIGDLRWMAGDWVQNTADLTARESWSPDGRMLVGMGLSARDEGEASFEFMRIAETPSGLVYFASPDGAAPEAFPLKEIAPDRVVFERPGSDFPKRIIYQRTPEGLSARIEGTLNGRPSSHDWRFVPARTLQ